MIQVNVIDEIKKKILSRLGNAITKDSLCNAIEEVINEYDFPISVSATTKEGKLDLKVSVTG